MSTTNSNQPRVMVVTPDFPPATGGIQRLVGELVARAAWNSLVVTLGDRDAADATPTHRVNNFGPARKLSIAALNLAAVFYGRRWRPDAILSCHVAVSPGCIVLGRILRVPVLQYVYAKEITDRADLARFALKRATATIAISNHTAELAARAGASRSRLIIIEPGVESGLYGRQRDKAQRPTILTVARLTDRYKGFDVMLRALPLVRSRIPSAQWVVVGEGELRAELEAAVVAARLSDAVLFTGTVTDADRDLQFRRAHVFAMPSRIPADGGGEGYGLVYLEAGAHGLPCVASNSGAGAEAVIDGQTGQLVDARDHVELADALVGLLGDAKRAAALGAAGRARAQNLSWDRMTRKVEVCVIETIARWSSR